MNEREQLLNRVRMYDFSILDVAQYLDGHPTDRTALAYYHKMRKLQDDARNAYETRFGPITQKSVNSETEWTWISDPWPWEGADN